MKILLAVLVVFTMASLSSAQKQPHADVIFIHGDIYTGMATCMSSVPTPRPCIIVSDLPLTESLALSEHRAQAIAVTGDKIVAVGSNDEIQEFKGPKTQV